MEQLHDRATQSDFGLRLVRELPRLRRHLAEAVPSGVHVDDLVQETVLRALEGAARFDTERLLWPWLRTIAERTRGRSAVRRGQPLVDEPPVDAAMAPGDGEELERLLERLPTPERDVIERYYVHDESVADIARSLGLAQGTVQSRMWRARRRLAVIAAALVPVVLAVIHTTSDEGTPAPPPPEYGALTLRTIEPDTPALELVEHGADRPFEWSVEGGDWLNDTMHEAND